MVNGDLQKISVRRAALLLHGLTIYTGLREDKVVQSLQFLLENLAAPEPDLVQVLKSYHEFCALAVANSWPDYLIELILQADNDFTRKAAQLGIDGVEKHLKSLVARDLSILQELSAITPGFLKTAASELMSEFYPQEMESQTPILGDYLLDPALWPEWTKVASGNNRKSTGAMAWLASIRETVKQTFKEAQNWGEVVEDLTHFHHRVGCGIFSSYVAFKWQSRSGGILEGVYPDEIRKEQLIGQDREQGIVLENTEFFLQGYPANNVILYGNRGTGKSSLVKALLHDYCDRGLRLIELAKNDLSDFPAVIRILAEHPQKFIIFIDDLSFDETEPEYKALKTLLEGGLEKRPTNVLIYATSNRRHLVRESFSERQGDEVHVRDNMEEKLSLADRFGITVTFPAPDQEGYLKIVEGLAQQHGLQIDRAELRQKALRWVMLHNARSGRTARQFIDYLVASQGTSGR